MAVAMVRTTVFEAPMSFDSPELNGFLRRTANRAVAGTPVTSAAHRSPAPAERATRPHRACDRSTRSGLRTGHGWLDRPGGCATTSVRTHRTGPGPFRP